MYYRFYCSCKDIFCFDLWRYQNKSNVFLKFSKYGITISFLKVCRWELKSSVLGLFRWHVLTCEKKHKIFCFVRAKAFSKDKLNIICEILKWRYLPISQPLPRFQFSNSLAQDECLRMQKSRFALGYTACYLDG